MSLFNISGGCCPTTTGTPTGGKSYNYSFSLRHTINGGMFLRNGDGLGSFSNLRPEVIPCDSNMVKLVITGQSDQFAVDIFKNGLLIYSLIKPNGNTKIVETTGLPSFLLNEELSVRVSGFSVPIKDPRVHILFQEI